MPHERYAIILDDVPGQASALASAFGRFRLTPKAFRQIDEALSFARANKGRIIFAVVDFILDDARGDVVAKQIREEGLASEIILLTAYKNSITTQELSELRDRGISVYDKPLDLDALLRDKAAILQNEVDVDASPTVPPASPEQSAISVVTRAVATDQERLQHQLDAQQAQVQAIAVSLARIEGARETMRHEEGITVGKRQVHFGRLAFWVCLITLFVAAATWLVPRGGPSTSGTASLIHVVLAENPVPLSSLTIVAKQQEIFQKHGLDVEVRRFPSGRAALEAVLGGAAQFATVAETPLVFATIAGLSPAVVATIAYSDKDCKVVVRRDRGVRTAADLKGKVVATAVGTSAEYFMHTFLQAHRLSVNDVKVVPLSPPEMPVALERGDIAGYFIWEPHVYAARKLLGERAVVLDSSGLYTETFNLTSTAAYVASNQEVAKRMVAAMLEAEAYVTNNKEAAISAVSTYTSVDLDALRAIWGDFTFRVVLEPFLLDSLQKEASWALATGKAKAASVPSFDTILKPEALRLSDPRRVTIP